MNKIITFLLLFSAAHSWAFKLNVGPKSIYNLDERELISSSTESKIKELSKSVGLIFYKDDLVDINNVEKNSTILSPLLTEKPPIGANYCPSEKFADHHAYKKACTGFLIAKDIVITAGHCFRSKNDCHRKAITFEATIENEDGRGFKILNSEIYTCEKIIAQEYDQSETLVDYAIIKLDRKTNRVPLKFRQAKSIEDNAAVFMIGHPLGLPKTFSSNARVLENTTDIYFKTTLDSFHGNSGSPVFNSKNFWVEGVMVRGEGDEIYNSENKCNRYATYSDADLTKGEGVTRMSAIIPSLFNQLGDEFQSLFDDSQFP